MSTKRQVLRQTISAIAFIGISGWPILASADDQRAEHAAAQTLFDEGRRLMAEGALDAACVKLEESVRMARYGGTLLNLGHCYEKQGRLAAAWSAFISAATVASHAGNGAREREARERAAALGPRLPKLVIRVPTAGELPGLVVRRDDLVVGLGQCGTPIPVDPGPHRVVVDAQDHRTWQITVEVEPGDTVTVDVPPLERIAEPARVAQSPSPNLEASRKQPVAMPVMLGTSEATRARPATSPTRGASEATSARRNTEVTVGTGEATSARRAASSTDLKSAALIVGGVGGMGLAAGSVFAVLSLLKHQQADEHCDGGDCGDRTGIELRDAARTFGNLSTAGFILGAAGVATGITIWVAAPNRSSAGAPLTRISLHDCWVGVSGAWD